MFSDTSRFNELFGIELKLYMVRQNEELANAVSQAQADGCVGVIGGDIVSARPPGRKNWPTSTFPPAARASTTR